MASSSRAVPLSRSPASRAQRRDCSGSWPSRAARARGSFPAMHHEKLQWLPPYGAALALTKHPERIAEIVLGHGPLERHALAGVFLQRVAKGDDGFLQPRGAAPTLGER